MKQDEPGNLRLLNFLTDVYALHHVLTRHSLYDYRSCVVSFRKFLLRQPTLADLTEENLTAFREWFEKSGTGGFSRRFIPCLNPKRQQGSVQGYGERDERQSEHAATPSP